MKTSNTYTILPLFVLFFSVNRGLIVLLAGGRISTQLFYYGLSALCVSISLLGITRKRNQFFAGRTLYQILMVNLLVYIIWLATELLLCSEADSITYFLYMALVPFIIYLFLDVNEEILSKMIFIVSVIVSISCVIDFILLNTDYIPNGKDYYIASQRLLRQDGKPLFYHVAFVYRAMGILGYSYDSGNFLAIASVFWFGMLVTRKIPWYQIVFIPIFFIALLMTFSVSNIAAAFVGVVAIILYKVRSLKFKNILMTSGACIAAYILYFVIDHFYSFNWSLLLIWTKKFNHFELEKMTALGTTDFFADVFMFIVGHARILKISNVPFTTEYAILQMAYHSGFFTWMITLLLILYPILCFAKSSRHKRKKMLPAVAAVAVGVLSLWHYGSVFRSTNIFLFYAMYTIAIRNKFQIYHSN